MISPPNSASTNRIGSSQNFFRIRMNIQSSLRKAPITGSELIAHRFWRRAWRPTLDPVAPGGRIEAET
jgi:hypothetical protein